MWTADVKSVLPVGKPFSFHNNFGNLPAHRKCTVQTNTHTHSHSQCRISRREREGVNCRPWTKLPSLSITINKPDDDDGFNNNNSNSPWVLFQITVTALATSPTEKWKARCLESSSSLPLLMGQIGRQSEQTGVLKDGCKNSRLSILPVELAQLQGKQNNRSWGITGKGRSRGESMPEFLSLSAGHT